MGEGRFGDLQPDAFESQSINIRLFHFPRAKDVVGCLSHFFASTKLFTEKSCIKYRILPLVASCLWQYKILPL